MSAQLYNHRYRGIPKDFSVGATSYLQLCGYVGDLLSVDVQNHHADDDIEVMLCKNPYMLSLDGTNDVVACDAAGVVAATATKGQISAGVHFDSGGAGNDTLFSVSDANAETALWIRRDNDDKLTASLVIAGTVSWTVITDNAIDLDEWCVVTLRQDGVKPVLYINGDAPAQTLSVSTSLTHWMANLTGIDTANIGALDYNSAGNADYFLGDIDWLEVIDHSVGGGMDIQYLVDEGTGNLADSSGNGNTGTVSGATWSQRFSGMLVGNDTGRIFHLDDDSEIRQGVWLYNPGANTITGRYKLGFARI